MQKSLIIDNSFDQAEKKRLEMRISSRKKLLMKWTDKVEQLRLVLSEIETQYTMRVGRLYNQDNGLDFEIIRYKKIKEFMDLGFTYHEAVLELDSRKKDNHQPNFDAETVDAEFLEWLKGLEVNQEKATEDIRKLWKKLLHKFHPDLTLDLDEKAKRTEIVKKINIAYKNLDIDALLAIEDDASLHADSIESQNSITHLEKMLVNLENAIIRQKNMFIELKDSQWYSWTKMKEVQRDDMMTSMAKTIEEDIKGKEMLLTELKQETQEKQSSSTGV